MILDQQYDAIISLGDWCGVAHNVRRRFRTSSAFPLDWWVVRWSALCKVLDDGFAGLFRPDRLQLDREVGVRCNYYGTGHPHDFQRDREGEVHPALAPQVPALREKYASLVARMDAVAARGSVLVIRQRLIEEGEAIEPAAALDRGCQLLKRLAARWPAAQLDLLVVDGGHAPALLTRPEGRLAFDVLGEAPDSNKWCSREWDALFDRQKVRCRPRTAVSLSSP